MTTLVVAALIERAGRILVSKRPEGKALAGQWELPGGKREPGEDPEHALARELREELGVEGRGFSIARVLFHSYPGPSGGPRDVLILVYRCAIEGEPQALDVAELCWAGPRELRSLPFVAADTDFLREIAAGLEGGA